MRVLLILLIAGVCIVTAKYIPYESSDTNTALYRVKRSDLDDSNSETASVERDDDSSNNNDNEDSQDNNSADKIINEEGNKLREKEEKKRQKLLEKMEKERQRANEEKIKLEEKLAKDQRKEQERMENLQRKLQERIDKEKQKLEDENRKLQQKLEKEERKRQEKVNKQLQKVLTEQKESAEDTYLETEEENSVEIEDIWKAHVYDKYGMNFTSTKLERQAALQRYLQEEMGISGNSTKSERRQAVLKLIQTKLQNDSVAVDSFRNLLLTQVSATQVQNLRLKLEKDLEKLNNQTEMLNNISLPGASVAKQNVEEKRTFLQTIAQFLSNIIPNWSSSQQIPAVGTANLNISNIASGPEQPSQSVAINDNSSINNEVADGETNLSVLPNESSSVSSLNKPLEPNALLGDNSLNNNSPVSQTNVNTLFSSTGISAPIDSLDNPALTSSGLLPSDPLESNVPVDNANVNGQPSVTDNLTNFESAIATESRPVSVTPSELNGSGSGIPVNNVPVSQTNVNGLPIANSDKNDLQNTPVPTSSVLSSGNPLEPSVGGASTNNDVSISQINIDGLPSTIDHVTDVNSLNAGAVTGFSSTSSNLLGDNISVGSSPLNHNQLSSRTDVNGQQLPNNVSLNSLASVDSESTSNIVDSGSLNNEVPITQTSINGLLSNTANTADTASSDPAVQTNSGPITSNSLDSTGLVGSSSLNNNIPINQIDVNGLSSITNDLVNNEPLNPIESGTITSITLENNESVNSVTLNDNVTGLPSSISDTANLPDPSVSNDLGNPLESNEPTGSDSTSNNSSVSQVNEVHSGTIDTLNAQTLIGSEVTPSNPLGQIGSVGSDSVNDNITADQSEGNELLSSDNSSFLNTIVTGSEITTTDGGLAISSLPIGSEQVSINPSVPTVPGFSIAGHSEDVINLSTSDGQNGIPVEISNVQATELSIPENAENVPTENVIISNGADASNNTNVAAVSIDGTVTSANSDSTAFADTAVNGDTLSSFNSNGTTLSVAINNEPVTSNFDAITDVISSNTLSISQNPTVQSAILPNTEANINIENTNADSQIDDYLTTPGNSEVVSGVETQTEQSILLVQEIINTPSDLVTVASVEASPSPPPGVIVPVEASASIVDIKVQ